MPPRPPRPDDSPPHAIRRREFFKRSGITLATTATAVIAPGFFIQRSGADIPPPPFTVRDLKVISPQPEYYAGWPTVARRSNGELWVAWSGGREQHVCPFGQVVAMSSRDAGETWTWPRVLLDSALDDRDAGVAETSKGTLIVTTFSSLAYEPSLASAEKSGQWPAEKLARWQAAHRRLNAESRVKELGQWMLRSTDGGISWSSRYACEPNSPHGPVPLRDGRLLYAGKELWTGKRRTGFWESKDDGITWRCLAELPARPGDHADNYHELHAAETVDGRIIAHIRNENPTHNNETLQSESADGGNTWSVPERPRLTDGSAGVWGLPSQLLRLRDGRLLMTYGHRRPPLGNQARLSSDHGRTWSPPMTLTSDAASGDLGYPSTVELDDHTLLTVWYEVMKGSSAAVLRQARWRLS